MSKIYTFRILIILIISYILPLNAMENKPYHHIVNEKGKTIAFRNPEGSPLRDKNFKWSFKKFNEAKKKLDMTIPKDHVIKRETVLKNLEKFKNDDYILWIGHASFILKLGKTTIITDPLFSKNSGPLIFGPKRYVDPAIKLEEIPRIDLFLLSHNHYDHLDYRTIQNFPHKKAKVLAPLNLGHYFERNHFKDVVEMDWGQTIEVNDLIVHFVPAVHWSKRSLTDTNKTLWGSFIIEYKDKKIFFSCDTGYGNIYKDLGKKHGPIDLLLINTGAYNFKAMGINRSIYHTNPEEALEIGRDLGAKKLIGMHWGTVVLSLEPIMEPPIRFKENAKHFGYSEEDAINFKIGEIRKLNDLI